jgi:hypothetical protein
MDRLKWLRRLWLRRRRLLLLLLLLERPVSCWSLIAWIRRLRGLGETLRRVSGIITWPIELSGLGF